MGQQCFYKVISRKNLKAKVVWDKKTFFLKKELAPTIPIIPSLYQIRKEGIFLREIEKASLLQINHYFNSWVKEQRTTDES